ncbi:DUF3732 domain-containing protein [Flavihumibacter petaseus]|uniref:DUF3732 domain-containing protein n=1 Tax=Flavihumibacter petaseus NBRC 106054 TaxID=1220578 RepID=A0A0E9MX52_9BACT|nr:DUF3732 domain-containing protein [Flavihumibacter petaseus]GAO42322.1 hypothetical protein FPE01S_01_13360 [Flavihumibacter petaseus NBRC 106054]
MKFYIKTITLWFENGAEKREINFLNNKVNVITGEKSKGKSSIISIIDYCLLSSYCSITEEVINESVSWYGLGFSINDKNFLIIRRKGSGGAGSKDIYFSSDGVVPETIEKNIDFNKLKGILEAEFGVNENIVIPYGGKKLKVGQKVSFRYFLLFNTLSEDTIAHTKIYFDFDLYKDREKYREALDRIFYLVIGVDDIGNVLIKEKIDSIEKDLIRNEKRKELASKKESNFNREVIQLAHYAQTLNLIDQKLYTFEEAVVVLETLINGFTSTNLSQNIIRKEQLEGEKRSLVRQIRRIEKFETEYVQYRNHLNESRDSLLPIDYLIDNYSEIIPSLEVNRFLLSLEESLTKVKELLADRKNIPLRISGHLSDLRKQLETVDLELSNYSVNPYEQIGEIQKFIFIGELKAQLAFYRSKWLDDETTSDIYLLEEELEHLKQELKNTDEIRKNLLDMLEESVQKYYGLIHSMGVYEGYKVTFDVKEKVLKLRKPDSPLPTLIGSKSNYMFLHLALFLGIHELLIKLEERYVPQFLILDQPSQPYFDKNNSDIEDVEDDDRKTLKDAFALLNTFVSNILEEYKNGFQIILLEHAAAEYWQDPLLEHFYLVEEFRNGNALIPNRAIVK